MTKTALDITGFPYAFDEYPGREPRDLSELTYLGEYTPPRDWVTMNRQHEAWMGKMNPLVHRMIREQPTKPLNIMTQMILFKRWAHDKGVFSKAGVIAKVHFSSIPPAYVMLDDQEAYKLIPLSEYNAP